MFKYFVLISFFISTFSAFGLEIDEKLTLRIVKVSQSKKTILINRGVEDGLVKGDHAKFFLTVGVVARAVVVKVSPTRSVWSVYRLVNSDYIKNDQVMKLKITAPVKITKDDSKMLVSEDTVTNMDDPRNLGIPLAEGADDIGQIKAQQNKQIANMNFSDSMMNIKSIKEKNKELSLSFHYSGQTALTTPSDDSGEYKANETNMVLSAGFEIYMKNEKSWYSRFSFLGLFSMTRSSAMSHKGDSVDENTSEFGGGVNWYPLTRPSKVYRFIPYGTFQFLMGSTTTTYTPGQSSGGTEETLNGGTIGYIIGGGVKYYTPRGYGVKFNFDYYTRGDSFAADSASTKWVKTKSGPRMNIGFLYRF